MKDIRAMKERFEEELKLAELGNNIEEVLIFSKSYFLFIALVYLRRYTNYF